MNSPIEPIYHFTPQIRKNSKNQHIQRLYHRISFIKERLQKYKNDTCQEIAQLAQINHVQQIFQNKVMGELEKCQQLKGMELNNHKKELENNLRTREQKQILNCDRNLYNLDGLNSKPNLNSQIFCHQSSPSQALQVPQAKDPPKNMRPGQTEQLNRSPTDKNPKNTPFRLKNQRPYLKETFLTSITLLLVCLVLWRFLLLF